MGAKQSQLTPSDVQALRSQSGFTDEEIRTFHKEFFKNHPKGRLTKEEMLKLYKKIYPKGDPAIVVDELFRAYDADHDGSIDFREFLCGLGLFTRGTEDEKLKLAFQMYDADGSGYISNSEMHALVRAIHKSYGGYDEKVADTVGAIMFEQLDKNRDNKITLDEFIQGAKRDPSIVRILKLDIVKS